MSFKNCLQHTYNPLVAHQLKITGIMVEVEYSVKIPPFCTFSSNLVIERRPPLWVSTTDLILVSFELQFTMVNSVLLLKHKVHEHCAKIPTLATHHYRMLINHAYAITGIVSF